MVYLLCMVLSFSLLFFVVLSLSLKFREVFWCLHIVKSVVTDLEGCFEQPCSRKTRSAHKVRTPGTSLWWLDTCEASDYCSTSSSDGWEWFVGIWPKINGKIASWWGDREALTSLTHDCLLILQRRIVLWERVTISTKKSVGSCPALGALWGTTQAVPGGSISQWQLQQNCSVLFSAGKTPVCSMCSSAGFTARPAHHLVGGGGDVLLSAFREQEEGKAAPAGFCTELFCFQKCQQI